MSWTSIRDMKVFKQKKIALAVQNVACKYFEHYTHMQYVMDGGPVPVKNSKRSHQFQILGHVIDNFFSSNQFTSVVATLVVVPVVPQPHFSLAPSNFLIFKLYSEISIISTLITVHSLQSLVNEIGWIPNSQFRLHGSWEYNKTETPQNTDRNHQILKFGGALIMIDCAGLS